MPCLSFLGFEICFLLPLIRTFSKSKGTCLNLDGTLISVTVFPEIFCIGWLNVEFDDSGLKAAEEGLEKPKPLDFAIQRATSSLFPTVAESDNN